MAQAPRSESEAMRNSGHRSRLIFRVLAVLFLAVNLPSLVGIICLGWVSLSDVPVSPLPAYTTQGAITAVACFAAPYLCLASWAAARELLEAPGQRAGLGGKVTAVCLIAMAMLVASLLLLGWGIRIFFPRAYLQPDETPLGATLAEAPMLLHALVSGMFAFRVLLPRRTVSGSLQPGSQSSEA